MAFFLKKTNADGTVQVDLDTAIVLTTVGGTGYTGNFVVEFEIDLISSNSVIFSSAGGAAGTNLVFFTSTTNVQIRRSDVSNEDFTLPSAAAGRHVYIIEGDSTANTIELFQDGVSCGTATGDFLFHIEEMYRFSGSARSHDTYTFKVSNGGVLKNNYVNASGTGSTFPDIEGGNDGTLSDFPTDGSQWEFYSSGITVTATLGTIEYASQNPTVGLTGDVDVTATLGTISYTSKNATVDVSGSVDVNATLSAIEYVSKNTTVGLTGSVDVTTTLGIIEYLSKNTSVDLTGSIDVAATLGAIEYASKNTSISITSDLDVTATLGTIDYVSKAATITLAGDVDVQATLGTITYTSSNAAVSLVGDVDINATLGLISYNSSNTTVSLGAGQVIGIVEAGFADNLYVSTFKENEVGSSSFKPNQITVTFKG